MGLFYPYASKNGPNPLGPQNDARLVGYADADYLSNPHKARSQSGYVFTIGNTTISWRSIKQTIVTTTSNHAEIIVLHEEIHECIWLRPIIKHIQDTCGLHSTVDGYIRR